MVGMRFNTIGVSDGISMGTEGMSFQPAEPRPDRRFDRNDHGRQWYDALIALPGCDKNMPGCLIAMGRLNRPAIMVYGGTIKPGSRRSEARHRQRLSMLWQYLAGQITEDSAARSSATVAPAPARAAACTPPTRWHRDRSTRHVAALFGQHSRRKTRQERRMRRPGGDPELLERDIKPRDIMTRTAFENAMVW
jgi:dihydroxy-acid dehydratase